MSERKKILFLITKATWGGAQKYVYDLAVNLSKTEFDVAVAHGPDGKLAEQLRAAGIRTIAISALQRDVSLFSDIRSLMEIHRIFRRERPDIVHLNSSKAAALGAIAARLLGIQNVTFTVHGWPFNEPRNVIARCVFFLVSWLTALLSDHVITVSKRDLAQAERILGVAKKTTHIPIGLADTDFLPADEARQALLRFLPDSEAGRGKRIILSIAELTKNKGIAFGIETMAELRRRGRSDFLYIVIGSGEMHGQLLAAAENFGLRECVHFAGFVPEASRYLRGADYFLLPSLKEGLPYVLLEAAHAGCCIVASDVGGIGDILKSYSRGILVPPRNPQKAADAILALEKNDAAHSPLSDIQTGYLLPEMLRSTLVVYRG